jgi:hypothetical protein
VLKNFLKRRFWGLLQLPFLGEVAKEAALRTYAIRMGHRDKCSSAEYTPREMANYYGYLTYIQ